MVVLIIVCVLDSSFLSFLGDEIVLKLVRWMCVYSRLIVFFVSRFRFLVFFRYMVCKFLLVVWLVVILVKFIMVIMIVNIVIRNVSCV